MERNASWGMLTTLNDNWATLLFISTYEWKGDWNQGDASPHHLQSQSTVQAACFNL